MGTRPRPRHAHKAGRPGRRSELQALRRGRRVDDPNLLLSRVGTRRGPGFEQRMEATPLTARHCCQGNRGRRKRAGEGETFEKDGCGRLRDPGGGGEAVGAGVSIFSQLAGAPRS